MSQASTPASATRPQADRTVFVVITMQNDAGTAGTSSHTLTVPAGTGHDVVLVHVMTKCVPEHLRSGVVLHYSVHPAVIA
ncbi:hypothetical protein [Streptosporangium sp. NPDC006930]|uniref:hypothetical protein n=1 Tax=Streptosporangium sp. NPDC006930 TaxID=3154783 RepID=UPI003422574E